jgi:transcriptional regulator GlxA family with amidase domain
MHIHFLIFDKMEVLDMAGPIDVLILSGGATSVINGIISGELDELVDWVSKQNEITPVIASVCVGAFFAAKAGVFSGLKATTHHGFYDELERWPTVRSRWNVGRVLLLTKYQRPAQLHRPLAFPQALTWPLIC